MGKTDLQHWLLQNRGFQERFGKLLVESVGKQFANLHHTLSPDPGEHDWRYLLMCGSLLAQSEDGACQDSALRIAQFCLQSEQTNSQLRDAAAVIFDILANHPAIRLAEDRSLLKPNFTERLPLTLLTDATRRSIQNAIYLGSVSVPVNHFQRRLWEGTQKSSWISASAPTSSGKSFILGRCVVEFLRNSENALVVYLVPTRALIQQVQDYLQTLVGAEKLDSVSVSALPLRRSPSSKKNVFVFTQERFHIMLGEKQAVPAVNLLIVDEAQKVGDKYRGVLLQQAVETVAARWPSCKVVFASPMTENPEALLDDAPLALERVTISSDDTMVNQNLLWVSQVTNRPAEWDVELVVDGKPRRIGQIILPSRPTHVSKRLPFVAFALGSRTGGNIIYVDGAAAAEKAAKQIYGLVGSVSEVDADEDVLALIELVRKTVHAKYSLAEVLTRGVAFHYGNMPLLIRTEVERLFGLGKIKYLVCTSTLIEGVNMPCQNIFARAPKKGKGSMMGPGDFWNLAGRAGRWGKEFQGNIVCVDARNEQLWKGTLPHGKSKSTITRTTDDVLAEPDKLLEFIEGGTPRKVARTSPNLEYTVAFLTASHVISDGIHNTPWAKRFPSRVVDQLATVIRDLHNRVSLPDSIILRNPGISPVAMSNLLAYFDRRSTLEERPVEDLLPVVPESDDAPQVYVKILHRINQHLGTVFGSGARTQQLARLIVDWMRGHPLARIIASRESYYSGKNLSNIIRDSMTDVEEIARFQAPKYLGCYVDLLRVHLDRLDRADLQDQLFSVNVYLEFGVSQMTQLSLMGLGLSRTSAVALSELIASDSFTEEQCIQWLRENEWMAEDMPRLVKRDITECLKKVS